MFLLPRKVLACLTCWPLTGDFLELGEFATAVGKKPQTGAYLCAAAPSLSPLWDPAHTESSPCSVLLQASPMSSQKPCPWDHLWNIYSPRMQEKKKQKACIILMESLIAKYWIIYSLIVQVILVRSLRLEDAINTFRKIWRLLLQTLFWCISESLKNRWDHFAGEELEYPLVDEISTDFSQSDAVK